MSAAELSGRVDAALAAGVDAANIVLDPGLGFAKTAAHNWALLARLDELTALGFPVLVGASRKAFLGRLLAGPDGAPAPVDDRERRDDRDHRAGRGEGAWGVRVHEVRTATLGCGLTVAAAWRGGRPWLTGSRCRACGSADTTVSTSTSAGDGQDFVVDATLWLDGRRPRPATTSPTPSTTAGWPTGSPPSSRASR